MEGRNKTSILFDNTLNEWTCGECQWKNIKVLRTWRGSCRSGSLILAVWVKHWAFEMDWKWRNPGGFPRGQAGQAKEKPPRTPSGEACNSPSSYLHDLYHPNPMEPLKKRFFFALEVVTALESWWLVMALCSSDVSRQVSTCRPGSLSRVYHPDVELHSISTHLYVPAASFATSFIESWPLQLSNYHSYINILYILTYCMFGGWNWHHLFFRRSFKALWVLRALRAFQQLYGNNEVDRHRCEPADGGWQRWDEYGRVHHMHCQVS